MPRQEVRAECLNTVQRVAVGPRGAGRESALGGVTANRALESTMIASDLVDRVSSGMRVARSTSESQPIGYRIVITVLLWLAAVVLVVVGLVLLIQGSIIAGVLLMVLGFLVGSGGYSIFSRRHA